MILISMRVVPLFIPPLARVVFLIYDNDWLLRYFLAQLFQFRISIENNMP